MNESDFLEWIHDRLEFVHKENHNFDYMIKLRAIILKKRQVDALITQLKEIK